MEPVGEVGGGKAAVVGHELGPEFGGWGEEAREADGVEGIAGEAPDVKKPGPGGEREGGGHEKGQLPAGRRGDSVGEFGFKKVRCDEGEEEVGAAVLAGECGGGGDEADGHGQ